MTELVFILDRSGSMAGLEGDTVGGFNAMLDKQRRLEEKTLVSTVLFNGECTVIHDRIPLERVPRLTAEEYSVGGCTALLDAVGGAIRHIAGIHKYARREDVPQRTLFVITTDGMENGSRRYTYEKVRRMIEKEKNKYGWEFLFLGANMDAAEAGRFGIAPDRAASYCCDSEGTALNYEVIGEAVMEMRCRGKVSADWAAPIADDVRKRGR